MTAEHVIEVTVGTGPAFRPVGYVLERDGLWFRSPRGETWHLTRPGTLRAWCGRQWGRSDTTRVMHVTWPWPQRGCWSCMDRRWSEGVQ